MRAVMSSVPPEILEWRKRTGADRWDEMWNGVLHIMPAPSNEHQNLEGAPESYLRSHWVKRTKAKVFHNANLAPIGGWPDDYRIPDLLLITSEKFSLNRKDYFEGAVNGVVEIHSPNDETYDKLSFYEDLGVSEAWVIHRDTKEPEIYLLKKSRYRKQRPVQGWLRSPLTGLELCANNTGKLLVRFIADDSTRAELPDD